MKFVFKFIKNMLRKWKQQDVDHFVSVETSYHPEFLFVMNLPYAEYIEFEEI